jgi:hypothetical protein
MNALTSQISYGRQSDILDPDLAQATHVTVCGLGTVGSHAAVELARMGVGGLTLIDGDVVECHNLPSQAFEVADIDRPKAEACRERVQAVSDFCAVDAQEIMLSGGESFPDGPVIMAVDNMEVRKQILDLSVAWRPNHPLVIDGRMGGKNLQLFALDPTDQTGLDFWNARWFPADEATPIACGGRSVSFVGSLVGGLIAAMVCKQIMGGEIPPYQELDLESFRHTRIKRRHMEAEVATLTAT